ncbi:MAG: hypothetical protein ICV87_08220, partial [Gemmatimonadetes bacterium]|nr:hypothetical protein [Gemmatimonadota bacterium]
MWRITTPMPGRPSEVHAYIVRLEDGWMLVDGGIGTEEAWSALDAGVGEAAGGWREVRLYLLTHMHFIFINSYFYKKVFVYICACDLRRRCRLLLSLPACLLLHLLP